MDFTLKSYKNLLESLKSAGYTFVTFRDYLQHITQSPNQEPGTLNPERFVILRHDVDLKPQNSLATAKIEHELDIKGSYYFRMVPESFNVDIIKEIARLGHEIGYHYETMDTAGRKTSHRPSDGGHGNVKAKKIAPLRLGENTSTTNTLLRGGELIDAAYQQFCENLEALRQVADITTICMHGSPRSKYDNKDIWKKYDYRKLGIIGEPYFDIDFNVFFYLTDTGRQWDGWRVSVRDKVSQQEKWNADGLVFKTTKDIITAANQNSLPERIMITVHPQRWTNSPIEWIKEYVMQNLKNIVKGIMISGIIRR